MNRSQSKIRHIQESNLILEKRVLLEKNILSRLFGGKKEKKEVSQEDIEKQLGYFADFEFDLYDNYKDSKRQKYKKLIHPESTENEMHVDLSNFDKGDTFYDYIEPVKEYLKKNDNEVELEKYKFKLHGNKIVIKK